MLELWKTDPFARDSWWNRRGKKYLKNANTEEGAELSGHNFSSFARGDESEPVYTLIFVSPPTHGRIFRVGGGGGGGAGLEENSTQGGFAAWFTVLI